MNLVEVLIVRNEVDIVRANVEHHLAKGVDRVVVVDNNSVDGTRDVLSSMEGGGYPIDVFDEKGENYAQAQWRTKAAFYAREELRAKWVISLDADEFLVTDGLIGEGLKDWVNMWEIPGVNYLPRREELALKGYRRDHNVVRVLVREHAKEAVEDYRGWETEPTKFLYTDWGKVLVATEGLLGIGAGAHWADFKRRVRRLLVGARVIHFAIGSFDNFELKLKYGGRAREKGFHSARLKWMYNLYLEGRARELYERLVPSTVELQGLVSSGKVEIDEARKWGRI